MSKLVFKVKAYYFFSKFLQYFELRFDKRIRLYGSVLFTVGTIMWLPIVIYVPALAFNQVTGVNIHIVTPVVCVVCIFYTCVGGLKAVVWTDVIQSFVMVGAIILVIIKGTSDVGGLKVVWQRNYDSGRLEFPTPTWDPTVRISIFSILVGGSIFYTQCIVGNQNIMQRFLAVPSVKEARKCLIYFSVGVFLLLSACVYNGLLLFAHYHDCDPLSTKLAKAKDQMVPLLVMDILSVFPGVPGLFVAGVFSAALSSLSTGLNSLAAVLLEDFIKPYVKTPFSERATALIMRVTVVLVGILCVGLVFVVEHLGAVVQLSMSLGSISMGSLFGLFLVGLLLPWINSKSALVGGICSFAIMSWICLNGQTAIATGELIYDEKPVTTAGCTYLFHTAANHTSNAPLSKTFFQQIYHISFLFYAALGSLLTIIFAGISSLIFGVNNPREMDTALLAPFLQKIFAPLEYNSVLMHEKFMVPRLEMKGELKSEDEQLNK